MHHIFLYLVRPEQFCLVFGEFGRVGRRGETGQETGVITLPLGLGTDSHLDTSDIKKVLSCTILSSQSNLCHQELFVSLDIRLL